MTIDVAVVNGLFESHAHLHYVEADLDGVLKRAKIAGVGHFVTVAVDIPSMKRAQLIAEAHSEIHFSCGVHPHESKHWSSDVEREVRSTLKHPKAVAVGETGLDFHYNSSPKDDQIKAFHAHLNIAKEVKKPLIIHSREAASEILAGLEAHRPFPDGGVVHCYVDTIPVAKKLFDLNFMVGFTGIVTFKNADSLREVVRSVPLERMLIETDTPYLAPVPYRGKPNEPAYLVEVARLIAKEKGIPVETVIEKTWENATSLFKIQNA